MTSDGGPERVARTVALPDTIGRYKIVGKLGEGGMGVVYEAEQLNTKRRVAVKVVRGGQFVDDSRVRMFQREAETLARLKHANIGGIYESGRTDDGQHFFAMELVRGATLDVYVETTRPTTLDAGELRFRLALFRKLADAVHYAHQRGVIHRDLKPSNIIVTDEAASDGAGTPEIKVLDFGLARITEGDIAAATRVTQVGVIKGTLAYMSPEQARGNPAEIDLRSDVYSLGVILYEMLAGRRPYDLADHSIVDAVRVICEHPVPPLARSLAGARRLDPDIETILGKALEKDADRRYASAAELSGDVSRYLTSQPILARPPSAVYQLRKFARRNRALVGGVAATIVVLVGGIVVSTIFGLREATHRREAEQARGDLEAVADFQARMLQGVDAERMGIGLFEDLRRREAEAVPADGGSERERAAALAAIEGRYRRLNPTDVALAILDENVIANAERAVGLELKGQPAVQARLDHTLASTAFRLGLFDRAEPLFHRSIDAYSSLGPEYETRAAAVRRDLALMRIHAGRMDEAEPEVTAALAAHRRLLGDDHSDTLQDLNVLALLHRERQRWDLAEDAYRDLAARSSRVHGDDHELTLTARDGLAWTYLEQNRHDDAEAIQRDVLERSRRALGADSMMTLSALNNLAVTLVQQGRLAEAEPLYREDLAASVRRLGREHTETHVSITNLGRLYVRMERYDDAEPLLRESIEIGRRRFESPHFGTGVALQSLGECLVATDRHAEAEGLLLESWDILAPILGEQHLGSTRLAASLAEVYRHLGDPTRAALWAARAAPA